MTENNIVQMLQNRLQHLEAQATPLIREMEQIRAALKAIDQVGTGVPIRVDPGPTGRPQSVAPPSTIRDQVLEVLKEGPKTPADLMVAVKTRYSREITVDNLKWHLSKMRREKDINKLPFGQFGLPGDGPSLFKK
jgi:hypothetical protein